MHGDTSDTSAASRKIWLSALLFFVVDISPLEASYCCATPDFGNDNSAPELAGCRQARAINESVALKCLKQSLQGKYLKMLMLSSNDGRFAGRLCPMAVFRRAP